MYGSPNPCYGIQWVVPRLRHDRDMGEDLDPKYRGEASLQGRVELVEIIESNSIGVKTRYHSSA